MTARWSRRAALLGGVAAVALPRAVAASRFEALFAPSAELWPRWTEHDPASTEQVDHRAWTVFLGRYLRPSPDGISRLAYASVTAGDRQALSAYLAALASVAVSRLSRAEQFAFWVNLYNALTVKIVLDAYPVRSIRDIAISPGLFTRGPWDAKRATIEGVALTLNDIEHRILRPIWRDARIHYAVNCASLGCPNLMASAFAASTLDAALERLARDYVNHPRGATIVADRLVASSLYAWFAEDFGGDDAAVIAHLRRHAELALADRLGGFARIDDFVYDWALNDAG
jgi:hypothetical protein